MKKTLRTSSLLLMGVTVGMVLLLAYPSAASAARRFTITLPVGSATVMSEPSLLNFTITNANTGTNTEKISRVDLFFNNGNTVVNGAPPPGWKVTYISGNRILFDTVDPYNPGCDAAALGNGQSALFGVTLLPPAGSAQATDGFATAQTLISNDCSTPGIPQFTFGLSGSWPTWQRRGLGATLTAAPSTIGVGGTVTLTMTVTNRTTVTQNAVAPVTNPTVTGSGSVTKLSGPTPASANLTSGASQEFTWTYQATGAGSVTFTATASNASVQTKSVSSNSVDIGTLTASLSVSPSQVTSGQQVTVTMTVSNNGASTLTNVIPSTLTPGGTATKTLVSGPSPAAIASLSPGAAGSFSWTYTVTGSAGTTYSFTGSASADGPITSNVATSNVGSIGAFTVTVAPNPIPTTTGATLVFTITNQTGYSLNMVRITAPSNQFTYQSASGGPSGNWSVSQSGNVVTFTAPNPSSYFPTGTSANFSITYSGVPANPNTYTFLIYMTATNGLGYSGGVDVIVTQYTLTLTAAPTTIVGDGVSQSTLTVTLTRKTGVTTNPVTGATVSLSTTLGLLSSSAVTTDANGQATATLTSIPTKTTVMATVTATYQMTITDSEQVTFTGITLSEVGYLAATAGNSQNILYWSNPSQYFTGILVVRKAGGAPTGTPADGTNYSVGQALGDGTVVYRGAASTFADTGLTNGSRYYYKIYTYYYSTPLYSNGQTTDSTPTDGLGGRPKWSYTLVGAGGSLGIPLPHGSGVYAASGNRLVGLNLTDGTQAWLSAPLGGSVQGWVVPWPKSGTWSDALGDWTTYTLYAGAMDGKVYAYDPTTGAKLWESPVLGNQIQATVAPQSWDLSNPAFQGNYTDGAGGPMDVLFVATRNTSVANNKLYALRGFADQTGNPGGSILWAFNDGVPPGDSQSVDIIVALPWVTLGSANRVYVASYSNGQTQPSLWAVSALSGSLQASKGTLSGTPAHLGDIAADPAVSWDETTLYLGTTSGYVVALNTSDLTEKWAANFSSGGSPIVGFIWEDWVNPGRLYFSTQDGYVRAIQDNGPGTAPTLLWQTATPISSVSTPLVSADSRQLWVGGAGGRVVQINLDTGAVQSTVTLGDGTETVGDPSTDSAGTTLYVGTSGRRIYALSLPLP